MENNSEKENINEEIDDGINLLDFLIVLLQWKKLILGITLSVAIITIIYSLTLPNIYKAETKVISTGTTSRETTYMRLLRQASNQGGITNLKFNIATLIEVLYTRPVYNKVIDTLGLMNEYEELGRGDLQELLAGKIQTEEPNYMSTVIIITAMDKDPVLAAKIANTFVAALKDRLKELSLTTVSQSRIFFEEQLKQASDALINAEEDMKAFQEKAGIMRTGGEINIPVDKFAPALLLEYKRILRRLKFNETLYEIIVNQYESAKVAESQNPLMIRVIEEAIPTEERVRPNRKKMVFLYTSVSFFFSIFLIFIIKFFEGSLQLQENIEKIEKIKKYLLYKKM